MTTIPYESLAEALRDRARRDPGGRALVFLYEDRPAEEMSNAQLHADAVAYARALQGLGIGAGDLVFLVLQHSRELVAAFWGAIYLGAIPSIAYYLTPKADPQMYENRVLMLVGLAGARAVVTVPALAETLAEPLAEAECRVLSIDQVPAGTIGQEVPPGTEPSRGESIAFLQFSSGTTGMPKGVLLSHRAVLNHMQALAEAFKVTEEDLTINWIPLYHDMGLISGFLLPLVSGFQSVLISPFHWVRAPKVLFQAVDEYGGTMTWMPNFAFNHCVRNVRERDMEGLDLSSWRILGNGSEPVRYESLQMFVERFAPYGLRKEALMVGYGMAENVVALSLTPVDREPDVDWVAVRDLQGAGRAVPVSPQAAGAWPVVSCGYPVPGTELRVVDEQGNPLPDRRVGQVIMRGTSMLTGYYRRPDLNEELIRDGWLYTGDMGYMVDEQIYLCGRSKDLVIVGGRNIYPQDAEDIANATPGIRPGRTVAFGVPDEYQGTEGLVLVCETQPDVSEVERREIERTLRRRVAQELDIALFDVRLVGKDWVIKTSSGKIARSANRQKYLDETSQSSSAA